MKPPALVTKTRLPPGLHLFLTEVLKILSVSSCQVCLRAYIDPVFVDREGSNPSRLFLEQRLDLIGHIIVCILWNEGDEVWIEGVNPRIDRKELRRLFLEGYHPLVI